MECFDIMITVKVCPTGELKKIDRRLVESAFEACSTSYAPYSGFRVGAAVLLSNGVTVTGSNQENEAYPSGLCAERVAMFYANSRYPDSAIVAIALASAVSGGSAGEFITPCGACRQTLLQSERRFGGKIKVLMATAETVRIVDSIEDLLPLSFKMRTGK